jgi:hypothetical protein
LKQIVLVALFGASFTTAALARDVNRDAPHHHTRGVTATSSPSAARCGGSLWRMKTLSDVDRNKVQLQAKSTTIETIRDLTPPRQTPSRRTTPFQKQAWEVVAQVVAFKRDGTEVRLQLYDHGAYLTAAIPSPTCLSALTRGRSSIAGAWTSFGTGCGRPEQAWQSLGAVAYIRGVGFWGPRGIGRGAPNGAELHPVTGFRIVVGCGG